MHSSKYALDFGLLRFSQFPYLRFYARILCNKTCMLVCFALENTIHYTLYHFKTNTNELSNPKVAKKLNNVKNFEISTLCPSQKCKKNIMGIFNNLCCEINAFINESLCCKYFSNINVATYRFLKKVTRIIAEILLNAMPDLLLTPNGHYCC